MTQRIVVAPDSFKGSLSATDVADAVRSGWLSVRPHDVLTALPQADGGEGTLDAIEVAVPGAVRHDVGPVEGPDGRPTPGVWLELPGGTAVVELAQMSGLPLMGELDALGASTYGLGQVIAAALDAGMTQVTIGLGGSASTDGGAGALAALGLRSADGRELPRGGGGLAGVTSIDRSRLRLPPARDVVVLTDVSAPLLGPLGAAAVFGPQKGATDEQVAALDAALDAFARALGGDATLPGTGAAGGAGFGFVSGWGATIQPGAAYIAELSGLPAAVAAADVVLTGEGRFDATSSTGKLVGEVIQLAGPHDTRVGIIAGQITATPLDSRGTELWSVALTDLAGSVEAAISDPARWLREAGAAAARALGPQG